MSIVAVISEGKLFQAAGPECEKALSPKSNTGWSCAVYTSQGISIKIELLSERLSRPYWVRAERYGDACWPYRILTLPDLRRRPGRSFFYTGPLDPVVTKAARSGSVLATTVAAGNVTILRLTCNSAYVATIF